MAAIVAVANALRHNRERNIVEAKVHQREGRSALGSMLLVALRRTMASAKVDLGVVVPSREWQDLLRGRAVLSATDDEWEVRSLELSATLVMWKYWIVVAGKRRGAICVLRFDLHPCERSLQIRSPEVLREH
ncbi:MAG: hypothetical protein ACP5O0_02360 [Acidimicrobiales bacterium]